MTGRSAADSFLAAGRTAWRSLAGRRLRTLAQPAVRMLVERQVARMLRQTAANPVPGPLIVSGLLSETKGVSEAARLTLKGLEAAGLNPVAHDLRTLLEQGPGAGAALPVDEPGGVWLIHANAPEALHALAYCRADTWARRYRIGYWAYELPVVPPLWARASRAFHEIWAPSRFVHDALRAAGVTTTVRIMPHPVALNIGTAAPDRSSFGLPADAFCVLAMGDLNSSATRKNLSGAVKAFGAAFGNDAGACLVVKTQSEADHPGFAREAERLGASLANVRFVTGAFDRQRMLSLTASCDLLFSPHRSEGFGLAPAEAFCLGVPALATGFSGNMDFMAELSELLIPHRLAPVRDPSGVYSDRNQLWAEPDMAAAVEQLRRLRGDPSLRTRLAQQGRKSVEALSAAWSPEALDDAPFRRFVQA